MLVIAIVVAALIAFVAVSVVVALTGIGVRAPQLAEPHPASTPDEAIAKLATLHAKDTERYAPACASVVLEPDDEPKATIVIFHGFTNCPNQFMQSAEQMRCRGYRILLPRQPGHGIADVLNHDLKDLTAAELVAHVSDVVDIAHGWPEPVYVSGLSGGAVLACWAAATRTDVVRVLASAPFAAPKGIPMPLVRLLVFYHRWLPAIYWWWDPRKKENLGESPYVYPGFPLPGMVPFLHLAAVLASRKVVPPHTLEYAGLTTNPGDFAVRHDSARRLMQREFSGHAERVVEWTFAKDLGWWHDYVDPDGSHHAEPEQIADVWLAALGLTDAGAVSALMSPRNLGAR